MDMSQIVEASPLHRSHN